MASKKVLTLVFLRRPGQILLGMKKRGFGQGRWNGFGGKGERNGREKSFCVLWNHQCPTKLSLSLFLNRENVNEKERQRREIFRDKGFRKTDVLSNSCLHFLPVLCGAPVEFLTVQFFS